MRKTIVEGMLALFVVTLSVSSISLAHQVGNLRDRQGALAAQVYTAVTSQQTPAVAPVGPKLMTLAPSYGAIGTQVTITGSGFSPANNTVYFSYHQLTGIPSTNGTSVTFTVPAALMYTCAPGLPCPTNTIQKVVPGLYNIMVVSNQGKSNLLSFMVIDPITVGTKVKITGMKPSVGPTGTKVTLTGTGFTSTGNNVTFGYIRLDAVRSNGKTLTFVVPKVDAREYPVWVMNSKGNSNAMIFTVPATPTPSPKPTTSPVYTPTISPMPTKTLIPSPSGTSTPKPTASATTTPIHNDGNL